MKEQIKLVIADSSELMHLAFTELFHTCKEVNLLGIASSENELLEKLDILCPDVLLIDTTQKEFDLLSLKEQGRLPADCRVVAITSEPDSYTILRTIKQGISSYVKKTCSLGEIIDSIKATHAGDNFFCKEILVVLNGNMNPNNVQNESLDTCSPVLISSREAEIIVLIAEGMTNPEIAERLFLSNHTVNTHRKNIMQKLGVNNTASVVMYAVKAGLVSPNSYSFSPALSN